MMSACLNRNINFDLPLKAVSLVYDLFQIHNINADEKNDCVRFVSKGENSFGKETQRLVEHGEHF